MWTRPQLKAEGKAAFKRNYWRAVLVGILLSLSLGGTTSWRVNTEGGEETTSMDALTTQISQMSDTEKLTLAGIILGVFSIITLVAVLIHAFLANPMRVGCMHFYRDNLQAPANVGEALSGFQENYLHNVGTMFLTNLFTALWSMLFLIPGIIKAYSYQMVPYILKDHPELSATETITLSRKMMDGNKWKAFLLDLSFIGWLVLGVLTFGLVLVFYTAPYMYSTDAALYETIKAEQSGY